jgi:hypothetical protein
MIGCAADLRIPSGMSAEGLREIAARFSSDMWEIIAGVGYVHIGVPRINEARLWLGEPNIKL